MVKKKAPIPSMDELMAYLNTQSGKIGKRELARAFGLKGDDKVILKEMLKSLKSEGKVFSEKGKKLSVKGALPERASVEITGLDSEGELIARPLEWPSDEPMPQIIIVKDKLNPPAGVGDIVQAKLTPVGNRLYEGEALRRLTAGENHMVCVFENGFVTSVDRRLKQAFRLKNLPVEKLHNRDIVIADIPMVRSRFPEATFVRKIGSETDPFAATLISIYLHNLPVMFSKAGENEAGKAAVPPKSKHREDLTTVPFVTIDGADARDFDDAVWAEPDADSSNKGGWHIMVAIADVAWYVRSGDALDMDARMRGNSVYFPDRVIPMLPEALSNKMCSLQPNQKRAAMVCEAWIDKTGHKIRHTFRRALIKSARRLTYEEVQSAMDGHTPVAGLENELAHLTGAYQALLKKRKRRGVLEIDVPERQVILNDKGQVVDIKKREITDSNRLIEELMILANVAAAETLEDKGWATMYRVHDRPSAEKIEALNAFLSTIGHSTNLRENADPSDFNAILTRADGTAKDFAINEFVLRSQSQAVYSPENIGHFGLALARYAHFTSPIRRYADILVHRALIGALKLGEGALTDDEVKTFEDTARHISYMERQAASAEQDAVDRYIAGYLVDKVGAKFKARISSVNTFGIFVRLDAYGADGFVPLSSLANDYYEIDEAGARLIGRETGRVFSCGDIVDVILKECVPVTGGMVFDIIGGGKKEKGIRRSALLKSKAPKKLKTKKEKRIKGKRKRG